jgi:hypothetical protein
MFSFRKYLFDGKMPFIMYVINKLNNTFEMKF